MTDPFISSEEKAAKPDWYFSIRKYEQPHLGKAIWQFSSTLISYLTLCTLMYVSYQKGYSYWIVLCLGLLAAGLLVRIFIFFHDCAHQSLFTSRKANTVLGYICGILTFTPFEEWRMSHGWHHNTSGDLDRRGRGDVWTMTSEEFCKASKPKQIWYRFFRNPIVLLCMGPVFLFVVSYRYPHKGGRRRQKISVVITNAAIAFIIAGASLTIGFKAYALIQFPILFFAGVIGVWLFYIQHQPPFMGALIINCRKSSSGLPAISDYTISIIFELVFRIITCKEPAMIRNQFSILSQLPFERASLVLS